MNQARSGLVAAQVGQNTTAKNVTNVNTEGYSRQRVDFESGEPQNYGKHRLGGGVVVGSVGRVSSDFVNKRIEEESSNQGKLAGAADIYQQLEMVFKEDGETGLNASVSKFFNDLRTLSTQPEAVPLRAAVRESASAIAGRFQTTATAVHDVVQDVDRRVEASVNDINRLTKRIAELNGRIADIEMRGTGGSANDERDQRDLAVRQLAKYVDIKTVPTETGAITVTAGRMGPLVLASESFDLGAFRSSEGPNPGTLRVFMMSQVNNTKPKDVTEKIEGGEVSGLLNIRDSVIPNLMGKIDQLAYNLASSVNGVHSQAYGRDGKNGVNFFEDPGSVHGAASRLALSQDVKSDLANIAAAEVPNAAGDNRALLKMADLQDAKIFEGGKANFTDYASSIVGKLGVEIKATNDNLETQKDLVGQLDTMREQVSGVSLDEEAMNMLKFQKAFDANAKMIQVSDQMMDTVLNLKRF
jgi:flagellar hook-associated protein 1 FlgK